MICKHCDDFTGICINPDCPMCADVCPVPDVDGICKFEAREEESYVLTLQGCAAVALRDAGLVQSIDDPAVDQFFRSFCDLMQKFGYVSGGD